MRRYITIVFLSLFISTTSVLAASPPDIIGESAILIDTKTNTILYEKNPNSRMYPASTTKILTSLLCIENLDLEAIMSKTLDSINNIPSDSSHAGLELGDVFTVLDGIYAVMLSSDNYISHDLALYLDHSIPSFANRMNDKARELGAKDSNFVNPHGYHHPDHYTTSSDLAKIAKAAFQNEVFLDVTKSANYKLFRYNNPNNFIELENTVQLIKPDSEFYNPASIGGKTGFHTPAGRCLVAAANKNNMELIGVILKSNNSRTDYFADMNALLDYGFDNFSFSESNNGGFIKNETYSTWAKEIVSKSIYHGFISKYDTSSYQEEISKKNFIKLLMKAVHLAEHKSLEDTSDEELIQRALDMNIIKDDSVLAKFYDPITRQEATLIIDSLLKSINYQPLLLYPISLYNDHSFIGEEYLQYVYNLQQSGIMGTPEDDFFHPTDNLKVEEALSLTNKLYDFYSKSLISYINAA